MSSNIWTERGDLLREMLDLRTVAEFYGVAFDRSGFACCPFHSEHTASFSVDRRGKFGHCFGCGINADVIKLVMQLCGVKYSDAVIKLNDDFSCGLNLEKPPTYRETLEAQRREKERREREQAKKAAEMAYIDEYYDLMKEQDRLSDNFRKYKPSTPSNNLHPLFVEACHNLDRVKNEIRDFPSAEEFITKRIDIYEQQQRSRNNDNNTRMDSRRLPSNSNTV